MTLVSSIAKKKPDEMIRHIPMIEQLIADSDLKYWAREAGLSVMAAIYKRKSRVLTVSEFSEVSAVPLFNRDINIRNSRLF